MGNVVELVVVVSLAAILHQSVQLGQCPFIQLFHIASRHQIVGVKLIEVTQTVAGGVTELQVVLSNLLEDLLGAAHVGVVVRRGCPQTDNIGTEVLDKVSGVNAVAQTLVHCTALSVNHPAVGQHLTEGSALIQSADRGQQGGLEPTTVLVSTFQINICGPQLGSVLHQGCVVSRAGVEPAVQGIGLLVKFLTAAVGAGEAIGNQLHRFLLKPYIGAVLVKEGRDLGDGIGIGNRLAAVLAVEHRDG